MGKGAMDPYGFDEILDLRGHHAQKWDSMADRTGVTAEDGIPMWVADMSFRAAPCIREAIEAEAARGYFGYFANTAPVSAALAGWLEEQHGWRIEPGWVRYTPGVVAGFANSLAAFTEPGESLVLFTPFYHSFFGKAAAMGREILQCPMPVSGGRYVMDFDRLAGMLTGRERMLVLSSPHNPGGCLWTAEELREAAAFCAAHDLLLVSDEIHMDLAFPGIRFVPAAVAAPDHVDRLIVLTAASKGFNIAGGETGAMIVPDKALRARLDKTLADRNGTPNRFGMAMMKAAFTGGADWSRAVRAYIARNFATFRREMNEIPGIEVMDMEATYLAWVDFAGTGLDLAEVRRRIALEARVGASPGAAFGKGGESFMRFNVALSRFQLDEAIGRLRGAFADLG